MLAQNPSPPDGPDDAVTVSARGYALSVPRDEPYLYYATFVAGQYSQLRIREGDVVLDAGANIGDFTLLAAGKVGKRGRVIAVEPNSKSIRYLRQNLARNHITNVEVVQSFLGSRLGRASSLERGTYSTIQDTPTPGSLEIDETTVDALSRERGVDHFDVVKLDVEGSEADVLTGYGSLAKVRECAIEVHSPDLKKEVRGILQRAGFHCTEFDSPRLVANVLFSLLLRPTELVVAERKLGRLAAESALKAIKGEAPSPSLRPESGVRMLYFRRHARAAL